MISNRLTMWAVCICNRFDDTNTENLRNAVQRSENDVNVFFFDPRRIDWEDYIVHTHIPGLVKHEF